jgi:UDP-N-acetylmuramoylalanine--D-glutamate ligase
MDLQSKKVLVIGAARSGIKTTEFLLSKGAQVYLNDLKENPEIPEIFNSNNNFHTIFGREPELSEISPDFIVVSPAVPLDKEFLLSAKERGIEIISELELSYRFAKAPFIGITGTNGKTTTTSLIGELFKTAGFNTLVGGNIGDPLVTEVEKIPENGVIVAEISSFQLEGIKEFAPQVAIITNLTPDHMDRHKTMENYLEAKARIFENQSEKDFLILNWDDSVIRELGKRSKGKVLFFSRKEEVNQGAFIEDGFLTVSFNGKKEKIIKPEEIFIKGGHNLENSMCGVLAGVVMGIDPKITAQVLRDFKGVEHRLEFSGEYMGVTYVNDSKGTNPDASLKALASYDQPIIIIAGGRNKGNSFDEYAKVIKDKCKFAVLIGESKFEIKEELDKIGFNNYFLTDNYEEAVQKTVQISEKGDVVLLSPACASWDMFPNYEIRGNQFKELVKKYNEK